MPNVTVREKKLANGKLSLFLDFFPPIINKATGKPTRREFLSMHVVEKPKNELERTQNREMRERAERICAKRKLELIDNEHGFIARSKRTADFLEFFKQEAEKHDSSTSSLSTWRSTLDYLTDFTSGVCTFSQINREFVEDFREYLLTCPSRRSPSSKLSHNTASAMFQRFCSVVRRVFEQGYLPSNPATGFKQIKTRQAKREFLELDELQRAAQTPCNIPENIRRAALFSALTGLRHVDIRNLTWGNVRVEKGGASLHFVAQKTKDVQVIPISDEAFDLLGNRDAPNVKPFDVLKSPDIMTSVHIARWMAAAGISKKITFHCFRHTYATLQIMAHTDLYTVCLMLGHSSIKQTEIYAHIVDERKREATGKISLK